MHLSDSKEYVCCDRSPVISAKDLSLLQRESLVKLNNKLAELEKIIDKECQDLAKKAEQRVADTNDIIDDYEAMFLITFCLKEDNPKYDEDIDNVLAQLTGWGSSIDNEIYNCNEFEHWEKHPMNTEFHCYLYHALYSHTDLGWVDILRIGMIWFDFEVTYQKFIEV